MKRISCLFAALIVVGSNIPTAAESGIGVTQCAVRFAKEVEVPALQSGRVLEVSVAINDMIESDDSIARLDDRSLLILRRAALLRLDSATADAQDDVEIRYAEVALAEAEAELDNSRSIQRDARGAIPQTQIRRLRLAVQRGELEVAQAKKRVKQAEVEARLREADLSVLDDQLRNLHLTSPISGVVLETKHSVGEWIEKGESMATIGRIDRLHVHALVDSKLIAPSLCTDLPVSVHWIDPSTAVKESLRGKVLSVDPQMLPGGRFRLHAEIINRTVEGSTNQWMLKPGTEVQMRVFSRSATARIQSRPVR